MTVTARTRVAAVVGRPVSHSLSPVIHTAWLEAAGIDGRYIALAPDNVDDFRALLSEQAGGTLGGCNVTAPYKGEAFAWAQEQGASIGPEARAAGSVNLLIFGGDGGRAESTDGLGMVQAIRERAPGLDFAAGSAVVLGAGGAGRAAVHALKAEGVTDIRVVNRTVERAEALAKVSGGVSAWPLDRIGEAMDGSHLLVNASSRVDSPDLAPMLAEGAVLDMTYQPLETPLLKSARARGLTPVDGLAMLIGQARPSFEALFGQPAPDIDVRALCLKAMETGA